ncbi:MAG TPA: hypothetical protein VGW39_01215 [Chthoniobacterales bacterium]|nr:hypothetical protein [Chthoniobacterales bacterium]
MDFEFLIAIATLDQQSLGFPAEGLAVEKSRHRETVVTLSIAFLLGSFHPILNHVVVVFMAADPDPFDCVANKLTDRAMMIPDSNREAITGAAFQLFEIERAMAVIPFP